MAANRRPDGATLRAWRQARGWDVTATAARLRGAAAANGDSVASQVSLEKMIYAWERDKHQITERYMLLYAAILGVTPKTLAAGPDESLSRVPVQRQGSDPALGPLTEKDVEIVREVLDSLTRSDRQFGGSHALAYASDYLRCVILPRLSGPGPSVVLRDLHAAACEFALRLASMHADAGDSTSSRHMLSAAFPFARETGDPVWVAWVLARCGEQRLDDNDPAQGAVWTSSAVAMAATAPAGARAFLTAKHALALAAAGDKKGCEQALGAAREAWERAGTVPEPVWMRSYGVAHITHDEARSRLALRQGQAAAIAAGESLANRTLARPRGFALAALSLSLLEARDIDRACAAARELISIASAGQSVRLNPAVAEVTRALAPFRRVGIVQDLLDYARTALSQR